MVPDKNNPNIIKLIRRLPLKSKPMYVPVIPEKFAKPNYCFPSVTEKIQRDGGSIIYGWLLRQGKYIVEAEFHAVWKSNEDNLIDIMPHENAPEKILFIPDNSKKYDGLQVDNIRLNISNNSLTDDFINICEALYRITNQGHLAYETGEIKLTGDSASNYHFLANAKIGILGMLDHGCSENSPCFCGTVLMYKHCHRTFIKNLISRL